MRLTRRSIDDAGQRIRVYSERPDDFKIVRAYRELRCLGLSTLFERVATLIEDEPCVLSCRVKRTDTIIRKLRRENAMDLSRMEDMIAFRTICASFGVQKRVCEKLRQGLQPKKIRDYTDAATSAGYRAIHIVMTQALSDPDGKVTYAYPCEIQLRTLFQHLWATTSESFGEQVKEGGGTSDEREYLKELSENIQSWENVNPEIFQIDNLKTTVTTSFWVIVFDKATGHSSLNEPFDNRLNDAVTRMLYLEELYRADFSHEIVLIGVPTGQSEARITHMRYFHYKGIPELSEAIRPKRERPV